MNGKINIDQLKIKEEYRSLVPRPTKDERAAILASMQENGFDYVFPIIINQDSVILDGHTRYDVAKELGIEDIYVVVKEFYDVYDEAIFVIVSNINRRQLNSAWRALLGITMWDLEEEKAKIRQIRKPKGFVTPYEGGTDLDEGESRIIAARKSGVSKNTLSKVRDILKAAEEDVDVRNAWEAVLAGERKSSINQVYYQIKRQEIIDSYHAEKEVRRITFSEVLFYHDDCFKILPLISDVDLAVIDPPYNITQNEWDTQMSDDEYIDWMYSWMKLVKNTLNSSYNLFLFCSSKYMARIELDVLRELDLPIQSRIVWVHLNAPSPRNVEFTFINKYDMIFHCGNKRLNFDVEWSRERNDVQEFALPMSNYLEDHGQHPTQKPIELIRRLVSLGSIDGDTVLDCFAGSGTLGEACNDVGNRKCILIENNNDYAKIIMRRCPNAK